MDTKLFLVGTSGWTYDHWRGHFYPQDLPKSKWFNYYATKFQIVEINATFYRTFIDQTYHNWRERAPAGFGYVLKAPRTITHRKYLEDVESDVKAFERSASLLEEKLEMILLQLAPGTPYDPERLRKALLAFVEPHKVAVEFRHKRWLTEETFSLLKELGAAFCNPDSPRNRLTDFVTSERAYLRLHGRQSWYSHDYSQEELQEIYTLVVGMVKQGAKKVYIFFNNDFEGNAVKNAQELMEIFGSY